MIISEDYARQLLDEALRHVDTPREYGAVLEGSIAAGFGNDASDIDFLILDRSDYDYPAMPAILFIDGRRVEVRIRSQRQVREQAKQVLAQVRRGPVRLAALTEDELNRCERLARALPLRNPQLVESVRAVLPAADLRGIVAAWFHARAQRSSRYAVALLALGLVEEAARWVGIGLIEAAKTWAARYGETYLERKWLTQQLERINAGEELQSRFRALMMRTNRKGCDVGDVLACLDLIADFGVSGCQADLEGIELAPVRGVTTWQIGNRLHIVRGRQDVFVLDSGAARTWRRLVFGSSVTAVVAGHPEPTSAGRLIATFHRMGLIGLRWPTGVPIGVGASSTPPPSATRPILSMEGAVRGADDPPVALLPIPARRFAAAGMAHVWENLMIENAREDMVGALGRRQWGTFSTTAERMLRYACLATLSAYGSSPLPPADEAPLRLLELGVVDARIRRALRDAEGLLGSNDGVRAQAALEALDALISEMRKAIGGDQFPSSFASAEGWRQTLEIGYDWIRLGGYLDSEFPVEDARNLIAAGSGQPISGGPVSVRAG